MKKLFSIFKIVGVILAVVELVAILSAMVSARKLLKSSSDIKGLEG